MNQSQKILVPVDFTPGSDKAFDLVSLLVSSLGAEVTLLHVYVPPDAASGLVPGADPTQDEAESRARSRDTIEHLRRGLALRGVSNIRVRIEPGSAEEVILDMAEREEYSLIVMGTHARTGLDRILHGSVAERIVRRSTIPVLTVHLPSEDP